MGDRTCREPECAKGAKAKGLCGSHYEAARKAAIAHECSVADCDKLARSIDGGPCDMHYQRLRLTGTTASSRPSVAESFWNHVRVEGDCWVYRPTQSDGYARFRGALAHRFAYEDMAATIPVGLVLDHLCMNKGCVRPDHLDPVPQSVNVGRARSARP